MTHTAFHTNRYYGNVLGLRPTGHLTTTPMPIKATTTSMSSRQATTSHTRLVASGTAPKFVVVRGN
jgi:hypothetical protein